MRHIPKEEKGGGKQETTRVRMDQVRRGSRRGEEVGGGRQGEKENTKESRGG